MLKPEEEGGDTKLPPRKVKDCQQPHARKRQGKILPQSHQREHDPVTPIPNFYPPKPERINFCCL